MQGHACSVSWSMLPRSARDHDDSASEPPNDSSCALLRCCCWTRAVQPAVNGGLLHLSRGSSGLQPALIRLRGADRCIAFMRHRRSIIDSLMRIAGYACLRAKHAFPGAIKIEAQCEPHRRRAVMR